jgi:hypothetical protein
MKPETLLIFALGVGALMVVIANDWWKKRLVEKKEKKNQKVRKDLRNNNTQWLLVVFLLLGIGIYAYLLNRPDLTNRDFGPITPLMRWLFQKH